MKNAIFFKTSSCTCFISAFYPHWQRLSFVQMQLGPDNRLMWSSMHPHVHSQRLFLSLFFGDETNIGSCRWMLLDRNDQRYKFVAPPLKKTTVNYEMMSWYAKFQICHRCAIFTMLHRDMPFPISCGSTARRLLINFSIIF